MSAVDFGVGAKYWLTEHVALRADLRDNVVSETFKYAYQNVEATVGAAFAFGGKGDSEAVAASATAAQATEVAAVNCPVPVPDTTPPGVSLTAPVNGATDVGWKRSVFVAFSEPMDPATLNSMTFYLQEGNDGVAGTVSDPTATSASITPAADLKPDTLYAARVTTGAKDLAGNALAGYVWSFKTNALPETNTETKIMIINKFVMLEDTHFEFDKAILTDAGKRMLDQNIKIMKDSPELTVRVAGYT